jgi:hypothetical protein
MNLFHRNPKLETVQLQTTSVPQRSLSPLENLALDDPNMYAALQNFLIVDPGRQIPLLDDVNTLQVKGDAAKADGNNMSARADYEVAAKIEIYKQNKESATNFLVLAEGVSDKQLEHHRYQETMLADMDKVLRISKSYQALPQSAKTAIA